jgi:flagellar hook-basal body complex protein FliE
MFPDAERGRSGTEARRDTLLSAIRVAIHAAGKLVKHMSDPLGFISGNQIQRPDFAKPAGGQSAGAQNGQGGGSFKDVLVKNLQEVNQAQQEAQRAVEDLTTGERSDVEGVILATQKADNAFRMLQQLRNRMMEAYDEVKQMRV